MSLDGAPSLGMDVEAIGKDASMFEARRLSSELVEVSLLRDIALTACAVGEDVSDVDIVCFAREGKIV